LVGARSSNISNISYKFSSKQNLQQFARLLEKTNIINQSDFCNDDLKLVSSIIKLEDPVKY
jgi:hypothetical protein